MSRIGKKIIDIPQKTEVVYTNGQVTVKGPHGELSRSLRNDIDVVVADGTVTLKPRKQSIEAQALWGTYASHIFNMIQGVNTPFEKKLELQGVGYKVDLQGSNLVLALGFSHPVTVPVPPELTVTVEKNTITVKGINKEAVGQFAASVRSLKKPEPYKGKGIRYQGEVVKMKQGKKTA